MAPRDTRKSSRGDLDVELLKAVAQAWHAQSGNPRPSSRASGAGGDDSDGAGALPRAGAARYRPSRFKLEAAAVAAAAVAAPPRETAWDFAQSLLDTYELVAVARKLESGLVIADQGEPAREAGKRPARESRRSLRNLLLRSGSRRFEEPHI
jgi:hypothetical protein